MVVGCCATEIDLRRTAPPFFSPLDQLVVGLVGVTLTIQAQRRQTTVRLAAPKMTVLDCDEGFTNTFFTFVHLRSLLSGMTDQDRHGTVRLSLARLCQRTIHDTCVSFQEIRICTRCHDASQKNPIHCSPTFEIGLNSPLPKSDRHHAIFLLLCKVSKQNKKTYLSVILL